MAEQAAGQVWIHLRIQLVSDLARAQLFTAFYHGGTPIDGLEKIPAMDDDFGVALF